MRTFLVYVHFRFDDFFLSFRDPLSTVDVKIECNGEQNGHNLDDDSEDNPLEGEHSIDDAALTNTNGPPKKKRKSSAEKFLEDNSEYYGFQVLPSKLRSSSLDQSNTFSSHPFLDFLHHRRSNSGDHDHGAGLNADDDNQKQREPHVSAENKIQYSLGRIMNLIFYINQGVGYFFYPKSHFSVKTHILAKLCNFTEFLFTK